MALRGIDHVQIAIPAGGEGAARRFYGEILGLREIDKPDGLSKEGVWFDLGGVQFHLGVDPNFSPATKAHPGFLTDDLDAVAVRLRDADYPFEADTRIRDARRGFTADPFGNRVELTEG